MNKNVEIQKEKRRLAWQAWTVGELRARLQGLPDDTPLYIECPACGEKLQFYRTKNHGTIDAPAIQIEMNEITDDDAAESLDRD